jgi:hypothetical protein
VAHRQALKIATALLIACCAETVKAGYVCPPGPDGEQVTTVYNFNSGRQDCITKTSTNTVVAGTNITVSYSTTTGAFTINSTASGGGGASSLAVTTGTSSGFATITSSPTAVEVDDQNYFKGQLTAGASYFRTVLTSTFTLQGNTFNGANQLLQLDSGKNFTVSGGTFTFGVNAASVAVTGPLSSTGTLTVDDPSNASGSKLTFNPAGTNPNLILNSKNAGSLGKLIYQTGGTTFSDILFFPQTLPVYEVDLASDTVSGNVVARYVVKGDTTTINDAQGNKILTMDSSSVTFWVKGQIPTLFTGSASATAKLVNGQVLPGQVSLSTDVIGSLPAASIANGSLGSGVLASSFPVNGVSAGFYNNSNVTVNPQGLITSISTGSSNATITVSTGAPTAVRSIISASATGINFSSNSFQGLLAGGSTAYVDLRLGLVPSVLFSTAPPSDTNLLQYNASSGTINWVAAIPDAARLGSTQTFSGQNTFASPSPSTFTYAIQIGSITGAGLATCGDGTHALNFSGTTNLFGCQAITAGGGSSSLAVGTGTAGNYNTTITSPTSNISLFGAQFTDTTSGTTNFISLNLSSITLLGNLSSTNSGVLHTVGGNMLNASQVSMSTDVVGIASSQNGGTGTSASPIPGSLLIGGADGNYHKAFLGAGVGMTISTGDMIVTANSTGPYTTFPPGPIQIVATSSMMVVSQISLSTGVTGTLGSGSVSGVILNQNSLQAGATAYPAAIAIGGASTGNLLQVSTNSTTVYPIAVSSQGAVTFQPPLVSSASFQHLNPSGVADFWINNSSVGATDSALSVVASTAGAYDVTFSTVAGGNYALDVTTTAHVNSIGPAPTPSSCGTGPTMASGSNDVHGTINVGTGVVTSCVLTFAIPFKNTPDCVVADNSATVSSGVTSKSNLSITVGSSATLGGGQITYICMGSD